MISPETARSSCTCACASTSTVQALATQARDAVDQAYAAERSRYRSVELVRAAAALEALVEAIPACAHSIGE